MMETNLAILFTLVAIYALFAAWLGRFSITMPMVFVVVGAVTGPYGLRLINLSLQTEGIKVLTEVTLGLLLFADAATLEFHQVRDDVRLPGRLLVIGLPLCVLLGGLAAYGLVPQAGIGFALLVGAILAPTDAALGLPIFNNPRVPVRIRRALNVESGLNDGLATPLVTLFIAVALTEQTPALGGGRIALALIQIAIAVGVGMMIGLVGGRLFTTARQRNWTSKTAEHIGILALALCAYFGSVALGGNGFIAAFVGGLLFGYASRGQAHEETEFDESGGTLLSLLVWFVFGSTLVMPLVLNINPLAILYAVLSLTVVRMIPVAIALIGLHMRVDTTLMMGWLGPRGLASVVFLIMAFEAAHEASVPAGDLLAMAGWTILLSVLLHGISAEPLANWYARRMSTADPESPELVEVAELRLRQRKSLSHQPTLGAN